MTVMNNKLPKMDLEHSEPISDIVLKLKPVLHTASFIFRLQKISPAYFSPIGNDYEAHLNIY